jgi:tetratricopeptide (TPR) repeat protein
MFSLVVTTPRGLAYAIPVAAVQLTVFILLKRGAMNGLTNPHSWWFIWPCVWNFVLLGLATVSLPNGRVIAPALFFAELGVSFYVYMPIVSDLRNPPMNWGYPRTWEGFKHAIMRGQYEAIGMTDVFSSKFLQQMGFYFQDLRMQFTLIAATLALLPFTFWKLVIKRVGKPNITLRAIYVSTILYVVTALLVLESELRSGEPWGRIDKILIALMGLLVLVGVGTILVRQTLHVINMIRSRSRKEEEKESESAVTITFGMDNVTQQWLIASGVCFAMMSILLVALANVKGDIQDGFIQKVKFISSHGMFSIWMGYGLVMGLVVANRWVRSLTSNTRIRKIAFIVLALAASLTCAIPVYENYTNDKLVFAMGSAEQNGHTFGWQFGAYQLEGANAIRNELSADEEPLPNPLWPDPMDRGAVFFGGTDPGRFVPTYMIYSANYRPDVYLITQNALADDTYMSVERDLYGDDIWIPSKEDSSKSFEIYVSEVQSGKRQANADLRIENGRVQVTGALGVMEINGILTRMMFDHEKFRRSFYIEESYVIQWMYPYLTPHGLIMKINPSEGALNANIVRNDMDFWDWYTRRLLRDDAFRRDFPAQKSFSKLRAAIAGLYGRMRYSALADQSFREAVLLYPASPEATFRYIQEILMPAAKWDSINDMLDYTDSVDPNNTRTAGMRSYLSRLRGVSEDIVKLKAKYDKKEATKEEALVLAQSYLSVGRMEEGYRIVTDIVSKPENAHNFSLLVQCSRIYVQCGMRGDAASTMKKALKVMPPNVPASVKRDMGMILADGGLDDDALKLLNESVSAQPKDAEAILAMVYIYAHTGRIRESQEMFIKAYHANSELVVTRLQNDTTLQKIAEPLMRRR